VPHCNGKDWGGGKKSFEIIANKTLQTAWNALAAITFLTLSRNNNNVAPVVPPPHRTPDEMKIISLQESLAESPATENRPRAKGWEKRGHQVLRRVRQGADMRGQH